MSARRETATIVAASTGALALWTALASPIFLIGTGLVRYYPLPLWQWWLYLPYYDANLTVRRWLLISAAVATVGPAVAAVCWPRRKLRQARPGEAAPAPRRANSDVHGSADWLSVIEARRRFSGSHPAYGCITLGEAYRVDGDRGARGSFDPDDRKTWGQGGKAPLLTDPCTNGATHGTVFAGSGGFKTTAVTLPTLVTWTGSAVVFDPPGSVAEMTTAMRQAMGHNTYTIAPGRMGVNVLAWIDTSEPTAEADVVDVLNWVGGPIAERATGANSDFITAGRNILVCLLADLLWDDTLAPEQKTLRELRRRVTLPERVLKGRMEDIAVESRSPMARELAGSLMEMYAKTFSGAYMSAMAETAFLAIGAYAAVVSDNDCDPRCIVQQQATVYLTVPMKDLDAAPALARVLVAAFQSALRRANGAVATGRVLFLLDEARFLGRLSTLTGMMTADRKYGATVVTLWQDETDQKAIWKDQAGIFAANSSWVMYAAVSDLPTSTTVSSLAGKYTVLADTEGTSRNSPGRSGNGTRGRNAGLSLAPRELIKPEEVRTRMRADEAIIFPRGAAAIRCGRAIYFRRPEMALRIKADPKRAAT